MIPDADEAATARDDDAPVFLDLATVRALVGGASTSTIYADPTFPLPVVLSHRRVRWLKHEVVAWMRAKIAARDAVAEQRRKELTERGERRRAKQRANAAA
jgi:predicted DNA-binding transcriptional regulator AlpA